MKWLLELVRPWVYKWICRYQARDWWISRSWRKMSEAPQLKKSDLYDGLESVVFRKKDNDNFPYLSAHICMIFSPKMIASRHTRKTNKVNAPIEADSQQFRIGGSGLERAGLKLRRSRMHLSNRQKWHSIAPQLITVPTHNPVSTIKRSRGIDIPQVHYRPERSSNCARSGECAGQRWWLVCHSVVDRSIGLASALAIRIVDWAVTPSLTPHFVPSRPCEEGVLLVPLQRPWLLRHNYWHTICILLSSLTVSLSLSPLRSAWTFISIAWVFFSPSRFPHWCDDLRCRRRVVSQSYVIHV